MSGLSGDGASGFDLEWFWAWLHSASDQHRQDNEREETFTLDGRGQRLLASAQERVEDARTSLADLNFDETQVGIAALTGEAATHFSKALWRRRASLPL